LFSTGCDYFPDGSTFISNVIDAFDRIDRQKLARDIVECFNNEDIEGLKDMFCDYVKDRHDLDAEISNAFDFLNGRITKWDYEIGPESKSIEYGRATYLQFVTNLEDISTESDDANTYLISYCYYERCDDYKETEGMTHLVVYRTPAGEKITYENYTVIGEGGVPRIAPKNKSSE
ncbi:MAG: DUF5104 domain-containing protein, partial [Ruminiclostridium sp.]